MPATVGVLDGALRVGLEDEQLARIATAGADARKVSPRDLAACIVDGGLGATTVGATLAACGLAGLRFLATGGIGGIHRGYGRTPDISADLAELARTRAVVVCSGAKSLLDVSATVEAMETLGIPLVGFGTDTVPPSTPRVAVRRSPCAQIPPAAVAEIAHTHWALGRETAVVVVRPPVPELDVTALIDDAVTRAREEGVEGPAVTPYVLAYLHEQSAGETLAVNRRLAADNAALAAQIASLYPRG